MHTDFQFLANLLISYMYLLDIDWYFNQLAIVAIATVFVEVM